MTSWYTKLIVYKAKEPSYTNIYPYVEEEKMDSYFPKCISVK